MKLSKKSLIRHGATLTLAGMIAMSAALPAFAEGISQSVTAGFLTTGISAAPTFTAVAFSHAAQNSDSDIVVLTADDSRGTAPTSLGWDVSMISTLLTNAATSTTIPATAVSVQAVGAIGSTNGLTTAVSNSVATGALDSPRVMMTATAANGVGTYTENVTLRIVVPANALPGSYDGTLTTTIATK